jgi:hypothetical protein
MFRWTEGDGELELDLEDESPEAVFREGVVALGDVLTEERGGEPLVREVRLRADDVSGLFAAMLTELTRLDHEEDFVSERVVRLALVGATLSAEVAGQRFAHERVVDEVIAAALVRDEDDGVIRATARVRLATGAA